MDSINTIARLTVRDSCRALAATLLTAVFGLRVDAAPDDTMLLSDTEFFADIPAIYSATRLPQPRSETPAAITVIDSEMIRASGARDLADLFRLVPGFQVAYSSREIPTITYHGIGDRLARRMLILIDGRSSYGAFIGNTNWSNLNLALDDIDRIEVIRSPNSAAYGANAFQGTINIITRHAAQIQDTRLKLTAGNQGILDGLARFATHFDSGDMRFTAYYRSEDGLDDVEDDLEVRSFSMRGDFRPGPRDTILLSLGWGDTDALRGDEDRILNPPATRESMLQHQHIRWQRQLDDGDSISLQFYHNRLDRNLEYRTEPLPSPPLPPALDGVELLINNDGTDQRFDLELQHIFHALDDLRIVWGLGARQDQAHSPSFFNSDETFRNQSARAFANVEWKFTPKTVFNAGAMLEHTEITDIDVSPRLALNYHLNDRHTVRAAWSTAKRIPTLLEEYGNRDISFMGIVIDQIYDNQGGLDAETMNSIELGYLASFPKAHLTFDARLYRDRIDDFITQVEVPATELRSDGALSFDNQGEITVDGLDLEFSYQPTRNSRIILTGALMQGSASGFGSEVPYSVRHFEASVPDYSASLLAMHRFKRHWFASLGAYWVDEMLWLTEQANVNQRPVEAYNRIDLRLARRLRVGDSRGEISLVVQNIGDDYEEFRPRQLFSTRGFVTVEWDF